MFYTLKTKKISDAMLKSDARREVILFTLANERFLRHIDVMVQHGSSF